MPECTSVMIIRWHHPPFPPSLQGVKVPSASPFWHVKKASHLWDQVLPRRNSVSNGVIARVRRR